MPSAAAVTVAVCAVVTTDAVAVNVAVVAPAATITDDGTVSALLLLDRSTVSPPAPAAAVSVTVQSSVPAPVSESLLHVSPLSTPSPVATAPVPVRPIVAVPDEALSVSVTAPVAAPAAVGSNPTVSVAVCPGFRVTGQLIPDMLKPFPVTEPALMVSAAVPVELSVTVCVDGVFSVTFPKLSTLGLSVSAGVRLDPSAFRVTA